MNKTVANLRKGDILSDTGEVIASSCRLSLLSRGRSMSKSYAQSHCEVRFENGREGIWHANTVVSVKS